MDIMLGRAQRGAPCVPGHGMRAADDRLLTATYGKEGGRTRVNVCASGAGARGAARSARGSVGGGGDRHRIANREPEQLTDQQLCASELPCPWLGVSHGAAVRAARMRMRKHGARA